MTTERPPGYCALCISRCGCTGTAEDGVLTRVDPDPLHPTGRALCVKARAAPEAVYHQERILHPLRRTHPKGAAEPGWKHISWDEALDLIADKVRATMEKQGTTGAAFGVASPRGVALPLETRYRKYRQSGFATPSGRVESHSERLRAAGQDPLPDFVVPTVPRGADFPLTLTTAKRPQYCHSQQRNQPSLRRLMPEPLVEINPQTAASRSIRDGDWVEVVTAVGRMRARARLDQHLAPEVACAQYGWWQFADGAGDANRLIDGEYFDPVAGSNSLRHFPCEVVLSSAGADCC